MRRSYLVAGPLILITRLADPADLPAQTRAAPLYALPADKSWVEYNWEATSPGGVRRVGTLRISSVGTSRLNGVPHRWVEITKEVRDGSRVQRRTRHAAR